MSPLRNTAPAPTQPRHMARVATALGSAVAAGLTSLVVACADGPTGPATPQPSAAAATASASFAGLSTQDATFDVNGDGKLDKSEQQAKHRAADLSKAQLDSLRADWNAYKKAVEHGATAEFLRCEPQDARSATKVIGAKGGVINVGQHRFEVPAGALDTAVRITMTAPSGAVREIDFEPHGLHFNKPVAMTISYKGCTVPAGDVPSVVYVNNGGHVVARMPAHDEHAATAVTALTDHFSGYLMSTGRR